MAAADQQAAQVAVADHLSAQVSAAWSALLHVGALKLTLPRLSVAVAALVHQYGRASAALAVHYYEERRLEAGVTGKFTPVPADPASADAVDEAVRWATRDLWSRQPDVTAARRSVQAVSEKLALDTGRDTVIGAVHADRKARGWARVTEPGACYFCAMLATRGMAYRSEKTADFRSHDHCRCHAEPVFTAYEPSAQIREWQALWHGSTRGHSGKAAIKAFRQEYEGRK
jgi:hypothetical protein